MSTVVELHARVGQQKGGRISSCCLGPLGSESMIVSKAQECTECTTSVRREEVVHAATALVRAAVHAAPAASRCSAMGNTMSEVLLAGTRLAEAGGKGIRDRELGELWGLSGFSAKEDRTS